MNSDILFIRDIIGIAYNPKLRYRISSLGRLYSDVGETTTRWGTDVENLRIVLGSIGEDGIAYTLNDVDWLEGRQLFPYVIHKEFDSFVQLFHYYVDLEYFLDSVFADFTWSVRLVSGMVCCKVIPVNYNSYNKTEVFWLDSADESYCRAVITKALMLWH